MMIVMVVVMNVMFVQNMFDGLFSSFALRPMFVCGIGAGFH